MLFDSPGRASIPRWVAWDFHVGERTDLGTHKPTISVSPTCARICSILGWSARAQVTTYLFTQNDRMHPASPQADLSGFRAPVPFEKHVHSIPRPCFV